MLVRMRFTEHELTAAMAGAAKSVVAASKEFRKSGSDIDTVWEAMDRYQRYTLLEALGGQVLPVLVALPDVEVRPGTRPTYTDRQVSEVVAGLVEEDLGRLKRTVLVKARTALVQAALASIPPRLDPDALLNPED